MNGPIMTPHTISRSSTCRTAIALVLGLAACVSARAAESRPLTQPLVELLTSAKPAKAAAPANRVEAARTSVTHEGFLRYLAAPPAHHFPVEGAAPRQYEATARQFLKKHAALFGARSPAVEFAHLKTRNRKDR